jgi:multicomponent Na+:H+ antiporter subunit A
MDMVLLPGIAAIFLTGFVAPLAARRLGDRLGVFLALVPLTVFAAFSTLIPVVVAGGTYQVVLPWVPALGISLSFFVDGLSLLFLLVISGVGTFIVWYAAGYLQGDRGLGKFYLYLFSFMGAMLGLVASDNLILLFVFWELTSITSYLLIGYYHEKERSRAAALQALLVTGGGGLAMLAGFILLGRIAGTYEISTLLELDPSGFIGHALFPVALVLILLGAFAKSAQFPFHFWLPNAMEAPAPVSAFLHSATMVKAGIFLLARLHPVLADHALWLSIVAPVGAFTMCAGVILGLGKRDLKQILAYSTLSVLGTLTLLLGLGTPLAIKACMIYFLAHALYKAALFMTAGSIDRETGTRDVDQLGGLRFKMPFTAGAALIAAWSMAGIPLLLGFVSKEYFYKALLDADGPPYLWEILGVGASMVMFALAVLAGLRPYFGKLVKTPKPPHEVPWTMWIGPVMLGVLAIYFGMVPGWPGDFLIGPAVQAIQANPAPLSRLALWHGWNAALFLSIVTVLGGLIVTALSRKVRSAEGFYGVLTRVGPERAYERGLAGFLRFSARLTRLIQNGYLRNYILVIGIFTALLLLSRMPDTPFRMDFSRMVPPTVLGVGACALIVAASVIVCRAQTRFAAIVSLGVVGLGLAILFFLFSAPDLAMTQILVEALTIVLFVLAFYKLPLMTHRSSLVTRWRDAILAIGFGGIMATMAMIAFHFEVSQPPISTFMGENSYPAAHGRNVVNVILVDFRALDTLGEVTVLAIAALGIYAMLKFRRSKKDPPQP